MLSEPASDNATRTKLLLIRKSNPPMIPAAVLPRRFGGNKAAALQRVSIRSPRWRDDSALPIHGQ
jgi:hypothetical protein